MRGTARRLFRLGRRRAPDRSEPSSAVASPPAGQRETSVTTARFAVDPARVPTTPSAALNLVRAITAGPDGYGPGYVKRSPYESDPADWPVLGTDCVWRQDPLPDDVLATITRYSRLPAAAAKGEVRTAATVSTAVTPRGAPPPAHGRYGRPGSPAPPRRPKPSSHPSVRGDGT
ncbi:hypothetical protein ABZ599_31865 [Streptomyces misionensis]|uniref:hypothetical protein n=1 Tax=Streptomyces misionensis TaxID=67331 RepID=UPI0034115CAC